MRRLAGIIACASVVALAGCTKQPVPSRAFSAFDASFAGWLRDASGADWHEGGGGGGGESDGVFQFAIDRTYRNLRLAPPDRAAEPVDLADVTSKVRAKVDAALAEAGVRTTGTGTGGAGLHYTYLTERGAGGISVWPYVDGSSTGLGGAACLHVYFWEAGR
ncbi:MAG: hypothetical protein K8T90_02905 [Planctomycetes bacterium]|nr:hypothetical protein [Planctomycetota bacterium]